MDNYKKYSLQQLNDWIHDAISCSGANPQEIYDVIKKAVEDEYYTYKHQTSQAYELLALLNGNGKEHIKECKSEDNLKKTPKTYNELLKEGWTMTADGFWIKE